MARDKGIGWSRVSGKKLGRRKHGAEKDNKLSPGTEHVVKLIFDLT